MNTFTCIRICIDSHVYMCNCCKKKISQMHIHTYMRVPLLLSQKRFVLQDYKDLFITLHYNVLLITLYYKIKIRITLYYKLQKDLEYLVLQSVVLHCITTSRFVLQCITRFYKMCITRNVYVYCIQIYIHVCVTRSRAAAAIAEKVCDTRKRLKEMCMCITYKCTYMFVLQDHMLPLPSPKRCVTQEKD